MQLRDGKRTDNSKIILHIRELPQPPILYRTHPYNTRSTKKRTLKKRHFYSTNKNNKIHQN